MQNVMQYLTATGKLVNYSFNAALLIIVLFLGLFTYGMVSDVGTTTGSSVSSKTASNRTTDTPNVVSSSMSQLFWRLGDMAEKANKQAGITLTYMSETAVKIASGIVSVVQKVLLFLVKFIVEIIKFIVMVIVQIVSWTFKLLIGTPVKIVQSATQTPVVSKVISPSQYIEEPTQIASITPLDFLPKADEATAKKATAEPKEASAAAGAVLATARSSDNVRWPIEGTITTRFGVPHWPYQPVHTGIDISDYNSSGITPIYPFKFGKVVKVVRSNQGLGNHIEVDHGENMISVYAHLATIDVEKGQTVDTNTKLGTQGSTGVSTGPHLHFEIRVNGKNVDPLPYLQT